MNLSRRAKRAALLFAALSTTFGAASAQTATRKAPVKKPVPPKSTTVKAVPPKAIPVKAAPFKSDKTAEQILDGYVEATGGKEAYAKITSTQATSTVALAAQGLSGTSVIYAKAPNKVLTVQTFEGIGTFQVGFDGTTGWSKDPLQGLRTLSGSELEQLKREANFNSAVEWRTLYKPEVVGLEKVDGKEAYVVKLTPLTGTGKPTLQYHDKQTLLIVRVDAISESPQGTVPSQSYPSDYRTVDGIKVAFGGRAKAGPAEFTTTITDIKNNVPIDDSKFAKPAN